MRHAAVWSAMALLLMSAEARADNNPNRRLQGDYAFTGTDGCVNTFAGFNANLTVKGSASAQTDAMQGVATFNGDGTGLRIGQTINVNAGGVGWVEFRAPFTYEVADDGTITIQSSAPITGTNLAGTATGLPFTVDDIRFAGRISEDGKWMILNSGDPHVETLITNNGPPNFRICHRSHVLIRIGRGSDKD